MFQVEDFESARRYVASYLQEKDTSAVAHKLNGQILEKLKQHEKVLGYFMSCDQYYVTIFAGPGQLQEGI